MGLSDLRELERLRAADPARARITALVRRVDPPLSQAELAEVEAWREGELARKASARALVDASRLEPADPEPHIVAGDLPAVETA